ncbi:MAG: dihydrolipoamide dehydrogenase [Flavobacteria bacterium RIFCSPLOWO2_12_FULL_35_11]|nr:MAG: dihydrolipoamide dehydrogenase [Flavobacteria bacterium RIFCSPLOWO2_12_FULL_35_11]
MKNLFMLMAVVGIASTINAQIKTPQPSPAAKMEQVVGLTDVTVEYSRPGMKGRTIFGDLVPYGEVWRTGANANTKITFGDDVTIGGKELKKGTYAIYTIPNATSWDVIFYSDATNWGNPAKWDESKVALKTAVEVHLLPNKIESFTMTFDDVNNDSAVLGILWENTYVGVKFEVPTDKTTMKSIETALAGPTKNDYFQAATYYHTSGKDLKQALEWMKKATAGDDPAFWYLRRMSLIQADLGDKAGAIATAKKSLAGAEKAGNADYIKMNKESIEEWTKK